MTASPSGTAPTWPRASASSVKPWITYWPSSASHSVGELPPCVSLPRNVSCIGRPSAYDLARVCSDYLSDAEPERGGSQGADGCSLPPMHENKRVSRGDELAAYPT